MKDVMAARIGAVRGAMAAAIRTEGLAAAKTQAVPIRPMFFIALPWHPAGCA